MLAASAAAFDLNAELMSFAMLSLEDTRTFYMSGRR